MIVNKDEVLQAIRILANDNGYDFFYNGCESKEHEEVLNIAVKSKEGDKRPLLNFVVSWSYRFLVTFDGANTPQYCKDWKQLLNVIKDWLVRGKV